MGSGDHRPPALKGPRLHPLNSEEISGKERKKEKKNSNKQDNYQHGASEY